MKKKNWPFPTALAAMLCCQPGHTVGWTEVTVEADTSFRLFVNMDSIHATHGLGAFRERKEFLRPQFTPDKKHLFVAAEAEGVVNCQDETLAYTGATLYSAQGTVVGQTHLPPSSWRFFDPALGSGGNQEIEIVCASLDGAPEHP